MSQELRAAGEKWLCVQQDDVTATDPRGNFVVYPVRADGTLGPAVWDRRTQEAINGTLPSLPPPPEPLGPDLPPITGTGGFAEIRVTDERDGPLLNRGYAYWSQAWVSGDLVHLFCGHADGHPRFFSVHLRTGEFKRLEALLGGHMNYKGTGEGMYWDASGWLYVPDGPRLTRFNPFTREEYAVMDISDMHPGCRLFQAHSSDDGRVHSATVERIVSDGAYPRVGTVVFCGDGRHRFYPPLGELDESALDATGRYLLIKETFRRNGKDRLDNRIIDLNGSGDMWVRDEDGAVGHSDCGPDYVVGEDDQIGACVKVDLHRPFGPDNRNSLFKTWGMGGVSVRAGRCLLSDATHLRLVALDGSGVTPLLKHGMVGDPKDYNYQVHGNLSPCGRVAMWMSNAAGRMDAYIGELP